MTYYDLGAYSRPVTTRSAEAQVWFDRGLNWVFGFNHAEAIKCFGKALALAAAYDAMQKALALAQGASPVEQALIRALPARYPQREPVEDQSGWDKAFTKAMRAVNAQFAGDLDVACVFADAIMNETPWKMWDLKTGGVAQGAGTHEAVALLEGLLETAPATPCATWCPIPAT
jgi:hypothetical protein